MSDLHKQRLADCQPDVVAFSTVINCWAKSKQPEAPERAESLLHHMHDSYAGGDKFSETKHCYIQFGDECLGAF